MVTTTFNPIIREEAYKNSFFPTIPVPGPRRAILLLSSLKRSSPYLITGETNVRTSDIRKGQYDQLVEIDLHPHNVSIQIEATANDQVSKFLVQITATAAVVDTCADAVYEAQVKDVAQLLDTILPVKVCDIASDYSVQDIPGLKRGLRDELGDSFYLEQGIQISNVNVVVRADKKYEEMLTRQRDIYYTTEYERNKARAAVEIESLYRNETSAIFSGVASGEIKADEAVRQVKQSLSKDFDERLRQIKAVKELINETKNQDLAGQSRGVERMELLLDSIVSSVSVSGQGMEGEVPRLLGSENKPNEVEGNPYAPIEDEE